MGQTDKKPVLKYTMEVFQRVARAVGVGAPSRRQSGRASGKRWLWGAMRRSRETVAQAEGLVCAKAWG